MREADTERQRVTEMERQRESVTRKRGRGVKVVLLHLNVAVSSLLNMALKAHRLC